MQEHINSTQLLILYDNYVLLWEILIKDRQIKLYLIKILRIFMKNKKCSIDLLYKLRMINLKDYRKKNKKANNGLIIINIKLDHPFSTNIRKECRVLQKECKVIL